MTEMLALAGVDSFLSLVDQEDIDFWPEINFQN